MPCNYKDYPADWPEIRERILRRADYRCECTGECMRDRPADGHAIGERCECEQAEINPETGAIVILTIAHLDHDVANSVDPNLKAMCQSCHLRLDALQHAISALYTRDQNGGQGSLFPKRFFMDQLAASGAKE